MSAPRCSFVDDERFEQSGALEALGNFNWTALWAIRLAWHCISRQAANKINRKAKYLASRVILLECLLTQHKLRQSAKKTVQPAFDCANACVSVSVYLYLESDLILLIEQSIHAVTLALDNVCSALTHNLHDFIWLKLPDKLGRSAVVVDPSTRTLFFLLRVRAIIQSSRFGRARTASVQVLVGVSNFVGLTRPGVRNPPGC